MAKNRNRTQHKPAESSKSAHEQRTSATEQVESAQESGSRMERKRQTKRFGHN